MKAIKVVSLCICLITCISASGATTIPAARVPGILMNTGSPADTAKLSSLIKLGFLSLSNGLNTIKKTEAYIDTAVTLCEKKNIDIPPALHLLRAEYYYQTGDYSNSEEEATFSMGKAESLGENNTLARTLLFLGRYYWRTGFYKESIAYYEKCITLAKKENLRGIIPKCYQGMAIVYDAAHDMKNYRKNMKFMIDAGQAENDTTSIEEGLLRLGSSYIEMERSFSKVDSILRRCVEISIMRKDTFFTAFASANIGWNYYLEKMYDSSIANYSRSLKYSLPAKQFSISANSFGNLGTISRDLGSSVRAIAYYNKAIDYAKLVNDWYSLSWVYHDMSELFIRAKDTSNAYISYIQYKQFNDSLLISRNAERMMDARVRYEADTHNKEVAMLSLRLKNNRLLNLGFIGLIFATIIIGFLIFRGLKLKEKREISEMNQKISELTQVNLRQQMNPHFIFNTLNSIQYYMYQHDNLATNNYLTKFSSLMRKVLENSHHTSIPLRDELDALNLYLELESLRFKDKFDYDISVDEEIDTLLFKVPTMLIQPYVENSICHGLMPKADKGTVKINLKLEENYIKCTIKDNGIGREAANEIMKKKGNNHNSLGTQIASSRLDLVNELYGTSLKIIYTDLKNEKGEPEGTLVEIHIPIIT